MMKKTILVGMVAMVTILGPVTQAHAYYECKAVARALFGKGPKLPGTWSIAEGYTKREACRNAKYVCRDRLDYKREVDGFPYPVAKCKRVGRAQLIYGHTP
ncbi:MAG: hypothetical protein AAFV69_13585 [Pseudomonadota bacterium]